MQRRTRNNPRVMQGILAVAQQANMPGLATQVATSAQIEDGRAQDGARYPLPVLLPNGGFRMDPHCSTRWRCRKAGSTRVRSAAPARGACCRSCRRRRATWRTTPSLRGEGVERLHDPGFSLEIGQRYVHYLARHDAVRGDLIRLLAAYNGGPGSLARWLPNAQRRADPLLFIESIPVHETRSYVTRVLTFSWIYAHRLGLPTPSLDQIAGGPNIS